MPDNKTSVDYTITNWVPNKKVEDEIQKVDSITVTVEIRDSTRPGESFPASYNIPRAALDSFPKEEPGRTNAAITFVEDRVDESHYQWMQQSPAPPPSKPLTRRQIAKMLTGDPEKEPTRILAKSSHHEGRVPEGLRRYQEDEEDVSPFGDDFEGVPVKPNKSESASDSDKGKEARS